MDRFSQLESQRDWQTLSEELEKAIAQESDGAVKSALFLRLGRVYENKFLAGAKALKLYQDAYKAQSSNVESLAAARSVYWDLGKLNMVQKLVELELKSNPHEEYACEILAELADVHFDLGEIEKATSTYARALSVSGGKSRAARSGLEDVQVDSASWQEHVGAILRTADAMENGEEKAKLYLRAARVTRRFAPEAVESQLSKAYAASPSNRQAAATFEGMLAENNRLDELEAAQTEILTNTSDRKLRSDHALTFARRWIQRHQNVEVGTRLLEAALRLDSSNDAPILYLREHARKTENSGLALGLAEEAATQATDPSLKAFYVAQAGVIAWKDAQDLLRARTWFDQLVSLDADHPLIAAFEAQIGEKLVPGKRAPSIIPPNFAERPRVSDRPTGPPPTVLMEEIDAASRRPRESVPPATVRAAEEQTTARDSVPPTKASEPPPPPAAEPARTPEPAAVASVPPPPQTPAPAPVAVTASIPPASAAATSSSGGASADPSKIAELRVQLEKQEAAKRYNEYVKTLLQLAQVVPDSAEKVEFYMKAADLYVNKFANQAEAVKAFEQVIAIDPEHPTASDYLRQMYEKRRDWEKLLNLQRREAERTVSAGDRAVKYIEMAKLATERVKKPELCIELWTEVLKSDEANVEALASLSLLYERTKEFDKLAEVLEKQAEVTYDAPSKIQILSKLGTIYGDRLENEAGAVEAWRALLALDPNDRKAQESLKKKYLALGRWDDLETFYADTGKWDEFIRVLEQQEAKETSNEGKITLLFKIAQLWAERKQKLDRAAKAYEKVLELDAANLQAAEALIPIYSQAGNAKLLATALEVKLGHESDENAKLELLRHLASLYETKVKDPGKAFERYVAAFEIAPMDERCAGDLERAAKATGEWARTVETVRGAITRVDEQGDTTAAVALRLRLGRIQLEEVKNVDEALKLYREVYEAENDNAVALAFLERLYRETNQFDSLLDVYKKRRDLSLDPDERRQIQFDLARLYELELKENEKAIETYNDVLVDNASDVDALASLDRLYGQLGKWDSYVETLQRRIELESNEKALIDLKYRLGTTLEKHAANVPGALDNYREILFIDPGHEEARASLEHLLDNEEVKSDAAAILEPIYEERGDWAKLVRALEILASGENDVAKRVGLQRKIARIGMSTGDHAKSFSALSIAIADDPANDETRAELENVASQSNSWKELVAVYEKVGEATSDEALARTYWFRAAYVYEQLQDIDQAAKGYNKVLALDPSDTDAMAALEALFVRTERWQDLIGVIQKRVELANEPEEREALLLRCARIYDDQLANPSEAIGAFRKVLEIDPSSGAALSALDGLYGRQKMWPELAENIEAQLGFATDDQAQMALMLRLASLRETEMGEVDQAVEGYRTVLERDLGNRTALDALERLGKDEKQEVAIAEILEPLYRQLGDFQKLIGVHEVQVRRADSNERKVELLHQIAQLHEDGAGDTRTAFDTFARALRLDASNETTQQAIDRVARISGRFEDLARVYEELGNEQSENMELATSLTTIAARVYELDLGNVEKSVELYKKVLASDSGNLGGVESLERIYRATERYSELSLILQRKSEVLSEPAEKKEALFQAAAIEEDVLDKPEVAIGVYQKILDLDPEDVHAMDALIKRNIGLGRWADLLGVYGKKADLVVDADEKKKIYYQMGAVHERELNDPKKGIETYQRILELDPDDRQALSRLDSLFEQTENWTELLNVLTRENEMSTDAVESISLQYRIANLYDTRLEDTNRSIELYRDLLNTDPQHAPTRVALELLKDGTKEPVAAALVLEPVYEAGGEWQALISTLEVQITHASDPSQKVDLLHRVARLQEEALGDLFAAFGTFSRAITFDNGNEVTLSSLERIGTLVERWGDVAKLYDAELEKLAENAERFVDLGLRSAQIYEVQLEKTDEAIDRYKRVLEKDAENSAAIRSLDRLYSQTERYRDLAGILAREAEISQNADEINEYKYRLAQLHETKLGEIGSAIAAYREILASSPDHVATVGALEQLFNRGESVGEVCELLEPIYRQTNEWEKLNAVYEAQVGIAKDPADKLAAYSRVAELQEEKLVDTASALHVYMRALKEFPLEEKVGEESHRLAPLVDNGWEILANGYADVLGVHEDKDTQAAIGKRLAKVFEDELGDIQKAEETYKYVLSVSELESESLNNLDRIYVSLESWSELAAILEQRIKATEDNVELVDLHSRLGEVYETKIEDQEEAVRVFRNVFDKLEKTNEGAVAALARLYESKREWKHLLEVNERELELVSGDVAEAEIRAKIARLSSAHLNDPARATAEWTKVLDLRGEDSEALGELANLHESAESWANLVEILERQFHVASADDDRVNILSRRARVFSDKLKDDDQALSDWNRLLDIDYANLSGLRAIANIRRRQGDPNELTVSLHQIVDRATHTLDSEELKEVYRELGKTYGEKLTQPFDAAEAWKKLLEVGPDFEAVDALEAIYRNEERWTDVIDVKMQRAAALVEPNEKIDEYRSVATIWTETLSDADAATPAYQKILEIDSAHDEAFFELEKRHQNASRWEQLIELYLARLESRTEVADRTELLRKIARVFEEHLDDKNQAFDALLTALSEDFHDRETARYLERMAQATGRWGELIQTVNNWIQETRKTPNREKEIRLCLYLAKWYGDDLGHPEHAQPYFSRIVQLDPNNVGAKRQLAQLYRKNAQWQQVGATLTSALDVAIADIDRKEIMSELGELLDSHMNQTDQGVSYFQRALEVDQHYLPAIENLERIYGARGNHRELADVLKRKVAAQTDVSEIATTKLRIGTLYEGALSDPQKASAAYREVVDLDGSNLLALRGLSRVYQSLQQWSDLVKTLEQELEVVTTEKEKIDVLMQLAKLQEEQFLKADLAAQRLEQTLEIDPNNEEAYFSLERNLAKLRQWLDLIQVYERHIAATLDRRTKVDLYGHIAQVYADEIEDADRAIDAYRNIVDLDETNVPALEALSKLYEKQGDTQQAIEMMTRVADLTPDPKQRVESFYRIAKALDEKLGDRVAAQERYELVLDIEPAHIQSLAALRQIALDNSDYDQAAKYIDQEQSYTPAPRQRAKLLVELGKLRDEKLGDHESAILSWEAALESDAENEDAALPLADEYIATSAWAKAEPLLDLLVRKAGKRDRAEQKELQKKLAKVAYETGNDEKSFKAYSAAQQLDLTDQETIRGIAEVTFRLKDWAASLTNFQKVLTALGEDEKEARTDIYFKLGAIKREQGQAKQAVANFEKAIAIDASHRPTLEALVSVYADLKDWKQVVAYKRSILDNVYDGDERYTMLLDIADVWKDKEKAPLKAVEALEEARDLKPTDHPLLHKLIELYQATESWEKMVDTISALSEMDNDAGRKSKYVFTIAQLYRDKLDDPDRALEQFEKALDLNPMLLVAFERLNKILTVKKDWKELERAYRRMLKRLKDVPAADVDKRLVHKLWEDLGLIYRDRLQNPASAIEAFKMATQSADADKQVNTRQILAELFEATEQSEAAIAEHMHILQADPMRLEPYRNLYRLYANKQDYDRAWCICAALAFLRKATEEEQKFFEDYRPKGMLQVKSRLDNEAWVRNLFHKEENLFVGKIFEMITPAAIVAKVNQLRAAKQLPVLDKRFKADPATSTTTFAKTFGWAATVLGTPSPELYIRNDIPGALAAIPASPPASVAGQTVLTGFTPQELTFIIGKHLGYYRGEHYIRNLFPTVNELKVMLFAGIKIASPDFSLPGEMSQAVETTAKELAKHMQPVQLESLRIVVRKFMEDGAKADLKRWVQTMEVTACRAGLLLCGDLEIAKKIVNVEPQLPGDLSPADKMKELLVFSVSEQYFSLRQTLGVAITAGG